MALLFLALDLGAEAHGLGRDARLDDVLDASKGTAADEQDVGRVDLQEVLLRVLATTLGRDRGDRALEDLEQRLLDALTGHVARDRGVVTLARDLVDLVDVDDAALGLLHVVVGVLKQRDDDVLDVLTDVARLGEAGRVGDREGHVEDAREGLREQGLARAGRPDQQDVALLQLGLVRALLDVDPLVVVVDRDRDDLLGPLLPDDVVVQHGADVLGLGDLARPLLPLFLLHFLSEDVVAQGDALVADVDGRSGDELLDLLLRFPAKRAAEVSASLVVGRHRSACPYPCSSPSGAEPSSFSSRRRTSSMSP